MRVLEKRAIAINNFESKLTWICSSVGMIEWSRLLVCSNFACRGILNHGRSIRMVRFGFRFMVSNSHMKLGWLFARVHLCFSMIIGDTRVRWLILIGFRAYRVTPGVDAMTAWHSGESLLDIIDCHSVVRRFEITVCEFIADSGRNIRYGIVDAIRHRGDEIVSFGFTNSVCL